MTAVLTWLCLACVAVGVVPVLTGLFTFAVVPFHAVRNHHRLAGPYLPRVAVVVPAWNEGAVIGASITRLMTLDYPADRLRVVLVDDASTDDTPAVAAALGARWPGRLAHVRREQGGQGKAHTLNAGLDHVLADDWAQAVLVMDADVVYAPESLRRMTRHLADPAVGAVTAYIREGSADTSVVTRFIGYEYVAAQAASRRAQNVLGPLACLAGGAQLHSRENLVDLGGRIDTTTLAEDTVTTFGTQLAGRRVVFEPHAVVLAEEPGTIAALWKQRLRWARGNLQVTRRYSHVWFRRSVDHGLGDWTFGLCWFAILLLPLTMLLSSAGLLGLWLLDGDTAAAAFRVLLFAALAAYLFLTTLTLQIDPETGRRSWREALAFPGLVSVAVLATALVPSLGDSPAWTLFSYLWVSLSMLAAWGLRRLEGTRAGRLAAPLLYLVGLGPLLCAISVAGWWAERRGAPMTWDKTVKSGRVAA